MQDDTPADENKKPDTTEYDEENIREITGRFAGLKDILMNKNADLTDKEALKSHLEASMKKCIDSIIYRGEEPDNLKELYLQGKISVSSQEKLHEISDELTELNKQYNDSDRELGMQEAMLNRLEGSVSYAISQIEERYGTYEEFECDDPDGYVKNNTVITRELEDGIKKEAAAGKKLENELKDIQVCRKDIERIMSGAGINIPDEEILKKTDMNIKDRITIVSAISNHDESTGGAVDLVSAALIIADKTDVRRDRVRSEKGKAAFDIHDRVNYAVTQHKLKVNVDKKTISLNLQIDTKICSMYEYFEIFLGRMMMCRGAADMLGATFKLMANGSKVL